MSLGVLLAHIFNIAVLCGFAVLAWKSSKDFRFKLLTFLVLVWVFINNTLYVPMDYRALVCLVIEVLALVVLGTLWLNMPFGTPLWKAKAVPVSSVLLAGLIVFDLVNYFL